MSEEEKIRRLLERFVSGGLVEKSVERFRGCFSKQILGIGLGEQGFVTSMDDVLAVFENGLKAEDDSVHTLNFERVEVMQVAEDFGIVCAQVQVFSHAADGVRKALCSRYNQSLSVIREDGEWKICGLHASTPVVTEEDVEAYPLVFAEKTLRSMREKIGEAAYLEEEQYRKAVLADSIAFYIVNFTEDCFEKCQLQDETCMAVTPGTPFEQTLRDTLPQYIHVDDRAEFVQNVSLTRIEQAFVDGISEVSCTYRMRCPQGGYFWAHTIVRLIQDVVTGARKGIMYVKNVDEEIRAAQTIKALAEYDSMTQVLNKGTVIQRVDELLQQRYAEVGDVMLMVDVDDFKTVNDTFGHPVGDQVLMTLAQILREVFEPPALIGRLGGDEFCVFLRGTKIDDTLRTKVAHLQMRVHDFRLAQEPELRFAISTGAAEMEAEGFESLYLAADNALYQAKRAGKDTAVFR